MSALYTFSIGGRFCLLGDFIFSMFLLGAVLLFRLDPKSLTSTGRVEWKSGANVSFVDYVWARGSFNDGNGASLDLWSKPVEAVCISCLFNRMRNADRNNGAGVIHCESGSLELRGCDFNACYSNRGGVVNFANMTASCSIDDCQFENSESKPRGAIIWMPQCLDGGHHTFSLTNSVFLYCKVRTSVRPDALFGPLIACHSLNQFTFAHNNFTWSEGQPEMRRCTALLEIGDQDPDTDILIENCVIANTDMPEGIVRVLNATKSVTCRHLDCTRIKCGNETFQACFMPCGEIGKVLLEDCHFREESSASQAFLDSAVFELAAPTELSVLGCTFSKCKCNHTAFLDIHDSQTVKVTDCTFNNIRFDESIDEPLLLHIDHCGNSVIEGINFHLPKMSSDPMSLSFTNGDFTFGRCSFLVDGGKNNQVQLGISAKSRFDSCVFTVDNYNSSSSELVPLLLYEGVETNSELVFYNCCFTHAATDLESTVPLYMDLTGHGNAKFESACFDVAKNLAMKVAQGIKPTFDREEIMFGDCECTIFLPPETFESLVPEESTPVPVPTRTEEGAKKADVGLITGTFFGILLLLLLLILLILFLLWRRKRNQESTTEPPPEEEPEETVTLTESGDAFDGATNDNPLFAHDLSTQDIFGNQFEEQSNFLTS